MPATVRVVATLVDEGKHEEAFVKLRDWLAANSLRRSQPDFLDFVRTQQAATLIRWLGQQTPEEQQRLIGKGGA